MAKSPITPKAEFAPAITYSTPGEALVLSVRIMEIYDEISHGAYNLFQERERAHGHDVDDWLRDESELMYPVPVEVKQYQDQLILRAGLPGFEAEEIEVSPTVPSFH